MNNKDINICKYDTFLKLILLVIICFMASFGVAQSRYSYDGFRLICTSDIQKFGDYNLKMEVMSIKDESKSDFSVKIDKDIIKIYNNSIDRMWKQDEVKLLGNKNGLYSFQSKSSVRKGLIGEMQYPSRYVYDKNKSMLIVYNITEYIIDGKINRTCGASVFYLKCY